MRNPFRSEGEAYRFLLLTAGAFAAVAGAALLGGSRAALPVSAAAIIAVGSLYLRRGGRGLRLRTAPPHVGGPGERGILVVTDVALTDGGTLAGEIERATGGRRPRVVVLSPAATSAFRRWTCDVDGARMRARERLDVSLRALRAHGVEARGEIGDGDALCAIEDALRTFGADEIFIATSPEEPRTRPGRWLVRDARERFALPITQLPIAPEARRTPRRDEATATTRVEPDAGAEVRDEDSRLIESILDNLSAWTVVAAAIALLYLVWVTLEILSRYVGGIPKVGP